MSANKFLLIDAGNQRLKWRFAGVDHGCDWNSAERECVMPDWASGSRSGEALVASVRSDRDNLELSESLQSAGFSVRFAKVVGDCRGLICGYQTPEQLGVDRWLGMLACWARLERGFVLVSAGTALTVDLVFNTGKHGGGYIAAGIGLGRGTLLSRSERLQRQYQPGKAELSPGRDTASAINNGALLSAVGLIRAAKNTSGMSDAQLVITGGDASALLPHFPGVAGWENIVLDGLLAWEAAIGNER